MDVIDVATPIVLVANRVFIKSTQQMWSVTTVEKYVVSRFFHRK